MPVSPIKESELDYLRTLQQLTIERVVCSGGGAKGVVYPGAYQALYETGVFQNVKHVAGASAGAITATFMAIGMPPAMLRTQLLHTEFSSLMGDTVSVVKTSKPGVTRLITKNGKPLEEFVRQNIIQTIRLFLNSLDATSSALNEDDQERLGLLYKKVNSEKPCITFSDLALLTELFPDHFKQLLVTAIHFPDGTPQVFNAQNTPDVEIARACRASASIPVVLEPVEINLNGVNQIFMDGGLYDNLPADYFDTDAKNQYIKNIKPAQTLVFAFGEGRNDRKNQVFQALYGPRWDEVFNEIILDSILEKAREIFNNEPRQYKSILNKKRLSSVLAAAAKQIFEEQVSSNKFSKEQADSFLEEFNRTLKKMASQPKELQSLLNSFNQSSNTNQARNILIKTIQETMTPKLYKANWLERFKRNFLVQVLGKLKACYKNTERKEAGYQKLRSEYALRTVELRVGDIKTTDFKKATTSARVMDALGYLDTINHITNHNLQDELQFDIVAFYTKFDSYFQNIYKAILLESDVKPEHDSLIKSIQAIVQNSGGQSPESIVRQKYNLIKDRIERQLDCPAAFALSLTIEFHHQQLTANELLKEVYKIGFKLRGIFSNSNITGTTIRRFKTLCESLRDENMFGLFANRNKAKNEGRMHQTINALQKIPEFNQAYDTYMRSRISP